MMFQPVLLLASLAVAAAGYWMEDVQHVGKSPYHADPNYRVFRNVKDFGAVGDGVTDDTAAINYAISFGERCGPGVCNSSTISPATVYFPSGTYLISDSIIDQFYTQLIGDPTDRPIIKASPAFTNQSFGLIDGNPYQEYGWLGWRSVSTFFRQVRNFVFDTTALPPGFRAVGVHWPSAQATSISNCEFYLSRAPGNNHTGLFIEEGSGGLLSDLTFYGGGTAAQLGNQQYTARNLRFHDAEIAILMSWDWGWTYQGLHFNNCRVGIEMDTYLNAVGSVTLLDSKFDNVETAIVTTRYAAQQVSTNGTLILDNVEFINVDRAVVGKRGVVLDQKNLQSTQENVFVMGHVADSRGLFAQTGYYTTAPRSPALLNEDGTYYTQSRPHFANVNNIFTARSAGAQGDGQTDDTVALNALFKAAAEGAGLAYLDAGIYIVTDTVFIPAGARIAGEALAAIIMGTGINFQDIRNPRPVIMVGEEGQEGVIQWVDTIISTRGSCPGAIAIQYNLHSDKRLISGMWDVHVRIGGFAGTELQLAQCDADTAPNGNVVDRDCIAAYMSMHVTRDAGQLFAENCWLWVADHDLEDPWVRKTSIFAGRGMLVESQRGQIWLSAASSEHHVLYQYQLSGTRDIYMGHVQTESPYFQPEPQARFPFPMVPSLNDPDFEGDCRGDTRSAACESAWALRIIDSSNVAVYGAGLYSFFDKYSDMCSRDNSTSHCQSRLLSVQGDVPGVQFFGLSTVASQVMVTKNNVDAIGADANKGTFADTLAVYTP